MKLLPIILVGVLGACENSGFRQDRALAQQADDSPAGRYQMLPGGKEGEDIFLLDTQSGVLRRCWYGVKDQLTVNCGKPSAPLS